MRKKLVAGNWKMHGSLQSNAALLSALVKVGQRIGVRRCGLSAVSLSWVRWQDLLTGSTGVLGARSRSVSMLSGAFTGEVSAAMLASSAVAMCWSGIPSGVHLVTASDAVRRCQVCQLRKVGGAGARLVPLVRRWRARIRETTAVVARRFGRARSWSVLLRLASAVVAYEPVWAIGTG
jgi:triosephosphate isomerase